MPLAGIRAGGGPSLKGRRTVPTATALDRTFAGFSCSTVAPIHTRNQAGEIFHNSSNHQSGRRPADSPLDANESSFSRRFGACVLITHLGEDGMGHLRSASWPPLHLTCPRATYWDTRTYILDAYMPMHRPGLQ